MHGVVERGPDLFPIGVGRGFIDGFAHKFLLAVAAADFGAGNFRRRKMRAGIKPAGQVFPARERTGLAREVGEHGLRHVFRRMFIAIDLPQGGGIDEVDVAFDQFRKRVLGIRPGKAVQ